MVFEYRIRVGKMFDLEDRNRAIEMIESRVARFRRGE